MVARLVLSWHLILSILKSLMEDGEAEGEEEVVEGEETVAAGDVVEDVGEEETGEVMEEVEEVEVVKVTGIALIQSEIVFSFLLLLYYFLKL